MFKMYEPEMTKNVSKYYIYSKTVCFFFRHCSSFLWVLGRYICIKLYNTGFLIILKKVLMTFFLFCYFLLLLTFSKALKCLNLY